jgi:hypothetical protein
MWSPTYAPLGSILTIALVLALAYVVKCSDNSATPGMSRLFHFTLKHSLLLAAVIGLVFSTYSMLQT